MCWSRISRAVAFISGETLIHGFECCYFVFSFVHVFLMQTITNIFHLTLFLVCSFAVFPSYSSHFQSECNVKRFSQNLAVIFCVTLDDFLTHAVLCECVCVFFLHFMFIHCFLVNKKRKKGQQIFGVNITKLNHAIFIISCLKFLLNVTQ